jgi:hypothetical protein
VNDITELRNNLFETIKDLRDKNKPMDLDRAKTIAKVGQVIVNSAKIEVDFMKISGGLGTGFIPEQKALAGPGGEPPVRKHLIK